MEEHVYEKIEDRLAEYIGMIRRKRNPVSDVEVARGALATVEIALGEEGYWFMQCREEVKASEGGE